MYVIFIYFFKFIFSIASSTKVNLFVYTFLLNRHRVVNLFIQGYNKSWVSAEEHSLEEKLIEDLAMVSSAI